MATSPADATPLCIDCDGTLIKTDLLHEGLLLLIKQSPLSLLSIPGWLLRGKAYFKQRVAEKVRFDWASLPYVDKVLALIDEARSEGRQVILATASPEAWAEGIANHVGRFDKVLATRDGENLSGEQKSRKLVELFGDRGFEYAGNSRTDLPVWQHARSAIVVSSDERLVESARSAAPVRSVIPDERATLWTYVRALRPHQWVKNVLVFVPLVTAHRLFNGADALSALLASVAFGCCASAVYVLNDLLDLEADRQHPTKSKRPFAAAQIPIPHGVALGAAALCCAALLCSMLPPLFGLALASYLFVTIAYSVRLKRQVIVDVILLASLYTMRVIAGAAAVRLVPSFWLLTLSIFVFLSLAMVKRFSELSATRKRSQESAAGRGYVMDDLPVLLSLGVSAGVAAVLVLALYINEPETRRLYPSTLWLWLIPPLFLYWISRIWMKAGRGEVNEDPVLFAIRDWQSLLTAFLKVTFFALASIDID